MRTLSQSEALALWENGRGLHPLDQGILAVAAAFPESRDSVADWPLGRRNRALAEIYTRAIGPNVRGWTRCFRCNAQLEFALDLRALLANTAAAPTEEIVIGGNRFRLPTSRDLAAVALENAGGVERLLARCAAQDQPAEWTEEELEAIESQLEAADPLAEILLHFDCPDCGGSFDESLELTEFLWAELERRARRTLEDVHVLAAAYGWSEEEILALSPARRRLYVDRVRA